MQNRCPSSCRLHLGDGAKTCNSRLDLFPQARLKIYLTESQLPETEAFSSQRILVKPIGSRRRSWFAAVARLLFSRPNPLIIVAGRGQELRRERLHRRAESEQSHPWPAGRERR